MSYHISHNIPSSLIINNDLTLYGNLSSVNNNLYFSTPSQVFMLDYSKLDFFSIFPLDTTFRIPITNLNFT